MLNFPYSRWSKEEEQKLEAAIAKYGEEDLQKLADEMKPRKFVSLSLSVLSFTSNSSR